MAQKMTKKRVLEGLKAFGDIDDDTKKAIVCALVGHSRIVQNCFGQITCARCDAIVGDALAGYYDGSNKVFMQHNCEACRAQYETLTWRSKLFAPSKKEIFSDGTQKDKEEG